MRPLLLLALFAALVGCPQTLPDDDDTVADDDDTSVADDDDTSVDDDDTSVDDDDTQVDDDDTSVDDDDTSVDDDDTSVDDDDAVSDSCSVAGALSCGGQDVATGNTSTDASATDAVETYSCATFTMDGPEVAWEFTAPDSGNYRVSLTGLSADLDLFLLDGAADCDPSGCLDSSNRGGNNDEDILFAAASGDRFVFVVDGFLNASGPFQLSIECDASGDDDDAFPDDDDTVLDDDDAAPATCTEDAALTCGAAPATGDTTGGPADVDDWGCVTYPLSGPEDVYEFTAGDAGDYLLVLDDLQADLDLFLLDGSAGCDPASCLDNSSSGSTNDETIAFTATAGAVYYIAIDGWSAAESPYRLQIACPSAGDDDDTAPDDDDTAPDDDDTVLPGANPGDLVITEVLRNPTGTDGLKEWFEVLNTTEDPIDLAGWTISDLGSDSHVIASSKLIGPGSFAVLGGSESPAENGAADVDYGYGTAFLLGNSGDEIVLTAPNGIVIDQVAWGTGWPSTQGYSMSLDPNQSNAVANDSPANWCNSPSGVFGSNGDHGSPGVFNLGCAPTVTDSDGDGSSDADDCNDNDPTVYPFATEVACDNIDQNCDGVDFDPDADNDGWGSCEDDCNDNNPNVNPGETEVPSNGIDDDCNGVVDEAPLSCDFPESEANDSVVTADAMALDTTVCGVVVAPGDVDVFAVSVPAFTRVTINVDAAVDGSPLDSFVRLLDGGGNQLLANDDDPSGSLDSFLQFTAIDAGIFYVEVGDYQNNNGSPSHSYEMTVSSGDACDVYEVGGSGSPATAVPTVIGAFTCGEIDPPFLVFGTDEDWFSFVAQAGQTLRFDVFAQAFGSSLGAQLKIKNAAGQELAAAHPGGFTDPVLLYTFPATDTYYAVVEADLYLINDDGPYSLLIWEP
jgi:hypothetical protein